MTQTIEIKCPKCGLMLRLPQPRGRSQVVCPKCQRKIGLSAEGKVISAAQLDEFANLPAPVVAKAAPSRPKNFTAAPAPVRPQVETSPKPPPGTFHAPLNLRPARKTPAWVKKLIVPSICLALTMIAAAVLYSYRDSIPLAKYLPIESIVASIPLMDSHEKVLNELGDVSDSSVELLRSLRDANGPGDEQAMSKAVVSLVRMKDRCEDLRRRAVALPPASESQWVSLMEWMESKSEAKKQELKTSVDNTPTRTPSRVAQSAAFRQAAIDLMFALSDAGDTIRSAWKPIPEPTSREETIEYEALMAKRSIWQAVVSAESEADYLAIADAYEAAADQLDALLPRLEKLAPNKAMYSVGSPYFGESLSLDSGIAFGLQPLEKQFGDLDQSAVDRYSISLSRLTQVGTPGGYGDSMVGGPPPGGPGRPGSRSGPNGSGRPVYAPPPGFHSVPLEERIERAIRGIRAHHPIDRTVLIKVDNRVDGPEGDKLVDSLEQAVQARGSASFGFGTTGLIALFGPMTVQATADAVDWADVLSIDENQRMIHVRTKPKLPE
ncbi:hypothetical protein K227x_27230 [Rubripirellula lacrimiformis]|uniref:Uncharacterized protein n=1 Tax=Rubripirellula lacrimiformis TaxID=1930273 RepID=A0A517NB31_9BACT|nr:hypothetical protein [Rubripirellula lacrimiformis]QDT04333.1 hypothetical protein K227x_27230 [Rubripirellula lacrimiformis]